MIFRIRNKDFYNCELFDITQPNYFVREIIIILCNILITRVDIYKLLNNIILYTKYNIIATDVFCRIIIRIRIKL